MPLLLALGVSFGSYGYATHLRLATPAAPHGPRSCCPTCGHTLGALELVPLVGYLGLRGACRHCRAPISPLYPLSELAVGLAACLGGLLGGWGGGAAAIILALSLLIGLGIWRRRRRRSMSVGSPGVALLENLIAIALITIISAPVLNVIVHGMALGQTIQERAAMTGLARQRMNELESIARLRGYGPLQAEWGRGPLSMGPYTVEMTEPIADDGSASGPSGKPWADKLYRVTVTVRPACAPQCTERYGAAKSQIVLTSYLWTK
jgi:hypothetical protein